MVSELCKEDAVSKRSEYEREERSEVSRFQLVSLKVVFLTVFFSSENDFLGALLRVTATNKPMKEDSS